MSVDPNPYGCDATVPDVVKLNVNSQYYKHKKMNNKTKTSVDELFDSLEQMNATAEAEYHNHLAQCPGCRKLIGQIRDHMVLVRKNSQPPEEKK